MSNEQTLNNPTTHDELAAAIADAAFAGKDDEVNRLMAYELPGPVEAADEEGDKDETVEKTDDTVQDETSDEGTVEDKDEAAGDSAASTPAVKDEKQEEDELTKLRREMHELKSQAGRVPYLNRRTQELERELRQQRLNSKVAEATIPAQSKDESKSEIPDKIKQRIAALREIDSDTADILQDMWEATQAEKSKAADAVKTVVTEFSDAEAQRQEQEFLNQQYDSLVKEVPYAPKVFASKEWTEWKEQLTPGRKALAESVYADEVKIAINAFVSDMQARYGGAQKQAPAAVTPVVDQQQAEAASKVQENRERKLKANVDTTSATAKPNKQQMDEDALFKDYYAKLRKEYNI